MQCINALLDGPVSDSRFYCNLQLIAYINYLQSKPLLSVSDDWCAELDSALDFLAGERGTHPEDFVPYLQYMPKTQV